MLTRLLSAVAVIALPLVACATEYQTVDRPRQECRNEQVPVQSAEKGYGGALVGGIAGGILGNQVGGGAGKTIATAVGAMTGAVVGDRMSSSSSSSQTETVQRCRTVVDHVRVPVVGDEVIEEPAPVVEKRVYIEHPDPGVPHWQDDDDDDDDEEDDD